MATNKQIANEFGRIHSLFVAINTLTGCEGLEGSVLDLIEIGEAYAGMLTEKFDNLPDSAEGQKNDN